MGRLIAPNEGCTNDVESKEYAAIRLKQQIRMA